jgi:hypothetical protein
MNSVIRPFTRTRFSGCAIALVMVLRSRTILTERLVEAALTMIQEAKSFGKTKLARAADVRNWLLIVFYGGRFRGFQVRVSDRTILRHQRSGGDPLAHERRTHFFGFALSRAVQIGLSVRSAPES